MYEIMTTHGIVETTRRKLILHAGRAKHSGAIGLRDYALAKAITQLRNHCTPRGAHPKPQTDAFHRMYFCVRLSARKLDTGIKAIKSQISLTGQDAEYKITDDFQNCWVIRRTHHAGGDFATNKYLISHHKNLPIKVTIIPHNQARYAN